MSPAALETDYLVIGGGASGLVFTDTLINANPNVEVVIVDRRHRPGGHWNDAYPFVRLHQPSATYGVPSRPLGNDRIDEHGPNAGFYERASAPEIVDHFGRALDENMLPTGRVRFLGLHDYLGADDDGRHLAVNLLTGATTEIVVRRSLVDATAAESTIPSKHQPGFAVDPDAGLVSPNDLVDLAPGATGFTVIGCGKTAMDTCGWLLEAGVDPDRIRWIKPRDAWLFNRADFQPLDLIGGFLRMQATWVSAAAESTNNTEFINRMASAGHLVRLDPAVEPQAFRGAIVDQREVAALRSIERVERVGRIQGVGPDRLATAQGDLTVDPGEVIVDCTAAGIPRMEGGPVFEPNRITLRYITIGNVCLGAATLAAVEASDRPLEEKARLCPAIKFSGDAADLVLGMARPGMLGIAARGAEPDLVEWSAGCRLDPMGNAMRRMDDPEILNPLMQMGSSFGAALANLDRLASLA